MFETRDRLISAFGKDLMYIVEQWPQLSGEDIKEIYEQEIENVHAVYDSWEYVAKTRLMQVEEEYVKKHIVPFVDIKTFTNHIKELEKNDWLELKSGKLLVID